MPADKTTNNYLVPTDKYKSLVDKEIQKNYRKEDPNNVTKINREHGKTVKELELEDRVFKTAPRNAFVTLKDHKPDFQTRPSVRLINPTKPEIGRIAMQILDNMVKEIRSKTGLKQCTNTLEVIRWFKELKNSKKLHFVIFDIDSFYPTITPTLIEKTLDWAMAFVNVTPQQRKIIHQACQSFLYSEGVPWVKKGDVNFDVGMGAFHGAQACEIVGLFLLNLLKGLPNFQAILYRDDGLGVTSSTPRLQEKLRQSIVKIFAEQKLTITIEINLKRVNFLDVTLDLESGLYKPYRKPGDRPLYVSADSNHPPLILQNIPAGIERRLSDNSSNEEVFKEAIPIYQAELERCGFSHQLKFNPRNENVVKKCRKRKITWFNPPYSMDVATNVGKEFLTLVDFHFPPGHVLHSVLNRSTVKVSYRCLPNMGAQVAKHNGKLLRKSDGGSARPPPKCNCQVSKKKDCPIPGSCNQDGVVYQATVANSRGDSECYVGLAKNFKARYGKHTASMRKKTPENSTTLSSYFWRETEAGRDPKIVWKILESNIPTFYPVTKHCKLCLREKFNIAYKPQLATLNSRNEIFGHCRHIPATLIEQPPD